ncbi:glycosyl transferase [Microbacterium sp.]|uniref:glycosyl transferase n=1 Tax=Microbacterium sp. TaxID=51671 RepID=UPI002603758D|nr:glycosyl transferase [Microbacterium sp.]
MPTEPLPMRDAAGSAKPHLLYVAWGFPPCRGSGVYRAWASANAFATAGWDVTVLTVPREVFTMSTGVDESLERTVHPSIKIVRVPFHSAAYENDLRTWSRFRAHAPELWNVIDAKREQHSFPERTYGGWRPALELAADQVHRDHPVDLVLGTANPNVDFVPGLYLQERYGIPYVMDYRDAWQLDVFSGARLTSPSSEVAKLEARLINDAHAVWFVNEPILQWHAQLYPQAASRFRVVANGYDESPATAERVVDDELVFGYIGTISAAVPIDALLAGWKRARELSPALEKARIELWGHLNHTGVPNQSVVGQLETLAENDITYHGAVSKRDIGSVYGRFDALLLVLGTGRYVTSGKVFEYAATGLPIASVHDPVNAASDVLRDAPAWFPAADLSADAVAAALISSAEAATAQSADERAAAQEWAQQFQRAQQLDPQIQALRGFVDQRRAAV